MSARLVFTILGCGSSPGVPRISGDWGACDPKNPKNVRLRASLLIERIAEDGGRTTVLVDTGPDLRQQMIAARVRHLDAVVYTHSHADHLHGIDDLRGYFIDAKRPVPIHADHATMERIRDGFRYCLDGAQAGGYPPIVEGHLIDHALSPIDIIGEGGRLTLVPLLQMHGQIHSLGFRVGNFAYCTDVSDFPAETLIKLTGLETLVIDTLQYRPHPSHLSLEQSLAWIERIGPRRAILTHMHTPLDYATVMAETPDHVEPAYDGMVIEFELDQAK